jgi:outer membrane protein
MRVTQSLRLLALLMIGYFLSGSGAPFFLSVHSQSVAPPLSPASELTLPQAMELALRTHPSMKVAAAGRQLADAQLQGARAGRLPLLQATETFTRSNNPVFVFGTLLEQARFGPTNFDVDSLNHPSSLSNFRSALTFRLPVFDQRQSQTRISRARIGQEQAVEQTELAVQQLSFEVIRSYYGVLLAQARLGVNDEAVKTAEADVRRARDMFDSGLVVQSDLLAAEVQLAEFRQHKIQATGDLAIAMAAMNTAIGLPLETPQRLAGQLVDRTFTVESVEELSQQALQNRPDYKRAVLSARANAVQLHGTKGEWLPRVDAFVTTGASSRYVVGGSSDYAAGATVTFNVFDAGRKARIAEARAAESVASAEQDQLASQIRFEVVRAYQQYISARERLAVVAQVTIQATETLRIVQDRYHAGLTTITELLRAETALERARSDVLEARYDQYVGFASVLLAAGRLRDVRAFGP